MRYVVIGAGGTGGIIAAALYKSGYDVSLIARGTHLQKIKEQGLTIKHMWDEEVENYPIPAFSESDFCETADVVFVCVKGYSIKDIVPFLNRISREDTLIIPILNVFTTGETLRSFLPDKYIADGCIYVSANIDEPGCLLQHSKVLRIIFGAGEGQEQREILDRVQDELLAAGIKAMNSSHIRRDAMKKFCYVSPIGAAGLYYIASAGAFQKEGEERDLYIGLMREIELLAEKMGCPFEDDVIGKNLNILDHQPPEATTSLQRDIAAGKLSEIQEQIYDIPVLGERYGVELPLYRKVSETMKLREGGASLN